MCSGMAPTCPSTESAMRESGRPMAEPDERHVGVLDQIVARAHLGGKFHGSNWYLWYGTMPQWNWTKDAIEIPTPEEMVELIGLNEGEIADLSTGDDPVKLRKALIKSIAARLAWIRSLDYKHGSHKPTTSLFRCSHCDYLVEVIAGAPVMTSCPNRGVGDHPDRRSWRKVRDGWYD